MVKRTNKTVRPFYFKDLSHKEMYNEIEKEFPIDMSKFEDLVNRIYFRYKILDKAKIALIVKLVFNTWRELLILGNTLHFNTLFTNAKLLFSTHTDKKNNKIYPKLRVKVSTPNRFRTIDHDRY